MRRILITNELINLANEYSNSLFVERDDRFIKPLVKLSNLRNDLMLLNPLPTYSIYVQYVDNIIKQYSLLNSLLPDSFDSFFNDYFNLTNAELSKNIQIGTINNEFYKWVVNAMRYDAVRAQEILPYLRKVGIKTCVYCNAQFAITTTRLDGTNEGMYELDHFYPKSKYPFLATSFFNLQPVCSHCNKNKSDNDSTFNLYTTNYRELDPFWFSLDTKSKMKYLINLDKEELHIIFDSLDLDLKKEHEDIFHISELYSEHKDVVEEIIWREKIYNDSFRKSIKNAFKGHFADRLDFHRFILGNYSKPNEIHKRPLAKLQQDIAKQLKLI